MIFWPTPLPESWGARSLAEHEPLVFFDGLRRLPLREYLDYQAARKLPPALRHKLEALLLWNDRTPYVAHLNSTPRFTWAQEAPWSLGRKAVFKPSVLDLEDKLAQIFSDDSFPAVQFHEAAVTHLKNLRGGTALVLEAPQSMMEVDRLLWMSYGTPLKIESQVLAYPSPNFVWRSFGTYVPRASVSALPEFSFWIDPLESREFFYTGLFRWGLFRRVFVSRQGKDPEKVWLQIDDLQQLNPPAGDRPDTFLWKLCPYLKNETLKFEDWVAPENNFFVHPRPQTASVGASIYSVFPGFFGESVDKWLAYWKLNPPPKNKDRGGVSTAPPANV